MDFKSTSLKILRSLRFKLYFFASVASDCSQRSSEEEWSMAEPDYMMADHGAEVNRDIKPPPKQRVI